MITLINETAADDGPVGGQQRLEQVGLDQRHVAGQDEQLAGRGAGRRSGPAAELGQRGGQGIARAPWLGLAGRVGAGRDGRPDGFDRRRPDDERPATGRELGGIEDIVDQRPAADRVEDLGQARLHSRAEPRGEDDCPCARELRLGCHALGGA